jgi:exonuclease V gamma subunit
MLRVHICPHLNDAFDHFWQHYRPAPRALVRQNGRSQVQHLTTSAHTGNWLTQNIARKQGISANQKPQFLASYLWQLVERSDADLSDRSPFEPSISVWAIDQYLQQPSSFAALVDAQAALSDTARFAMAMHLAQLFDRYLVFRLDWLAAWQKKKHLDLGAHETWQSDLWRYLLNQLPGIRSRHPFESLDDLLQSSHEPELEFKVRSQLQLPSQLIVWVMDSVPALYWDTLCRLAQYTDITLYLFDVSAAFTQDLVTRKQWLTKQLSDPLQATYLEVGHPLLSHWGRELAHQQRSLLDRDIDFDRMQDRESPSHLSTQAPTQLGWLQQSIESAFAPTQLELLAQAQAGPDDSLRLFSAHSTRRQLETLAVHLTQWLSDSLGDDNTKRTVADVLIICPDLATVRTYAPGVFQDFSVRYGQSLAQQHSWVEAILGWYQLIDQTQGQTSAQSVLNWLGLPHAQALVKVASSQVAQWQSWLQQAGVRNLSDWPVGFERLLLGMAVDLVPSSAILGRQPVSVGDESDLASLTTLATLFEQLILAQSQCHDARTIEQWLPILAAQFDSVQVTGIEAQEGQAALRSAVQTVQDNIQRSGAKPVISWSVLIAALTELLAAQRTGGVPSGALTFAGPNDIRHCAYKLIVWLGLDDGVFPRTTVKTAFDLMANKPRWGDQLVGVQDRGVFLESIMLAQEQLWLFYHGHDLRRNDPLNPSVLLTDLRRLMPWLEVQPIALATPIPEGLPLAQLSDWPLVTSGQSNHLNAAPATQQRDLRQLKRFVENPARHYAKEALGLHLEWRAGSIDEAQTWVLDTKTQGRLYTDLHQGLRQSLTDHPQFAPALLGAAQALTVEQSYRAIAMKRQTLEQFDVSIQDRDRYFANAVLGAWVEQLHHCATAPNPLPVTLFSWNEAKASHTLNVVPAQQAQATLAWLQAHEQATRNTPSLLFAQCALAWASGKSKEKIEIALLGGDEDAAFSASGDLSERYANLVWRANLPSLEAVLTFFETHLTTLRVMLSEESQD